MRLLGKKIAVEQELSASESEGGIALPESSRVKLPRGVVRAMGPEVSSVVKSGDYILFSTFAGAEVISYTTPGSAHTTVELLIIEDADIIAILDGEEVPDDS